ncbi:MAG TPA: glycosyltransferase [Usitatibacter sp.]|nr:glycosyltransferase [Usitatibacter sp.]
MIDVIIPVFRGFAATRRAVEAALHARCAQPREVIAIDDASPEPRISQWLEGLASRGALTLLRHPDNRGFVASVNEAMRLHGDRDVVLLNSDTQVSDGWLDRIAACAQGGGRVASISPFSNNATICSYPGFARSNPLPAGASAADLDALFARENAGASVEIPTTVGFCMFIARQALDDVGLFDEEAFGAGYGEEVDFCMRASRAGYKHLLCADTFVFHQGEVSFGGSGGERRIRAQAIVDARYPEFQPTVREFIQADPPRPFRRRVDIARLARSPRPRVLYAAAGNHPQIERHIRGLAAAQSAHVEALFLQVTDGAPALLRWLREGEAFEAACDLAGGRADCLALLGRLGVSQVEIHRSGELPEALASLAADLGVEAVTTIHQRAA